MRKVVALISIVISVAVTNMGVMSVNEAHGADSEQADPALQPPWFTGTLLSSRGRTMSQGHFVVQPYVYYTESGGVYSNNWRLQSATTSKNIIQQNYFIYGVTDWMDVELCPQWLQNYSQGATSNGFGDLSLQVGFQAVRGRADSWVPDVRVWVQELFPTGRFNNLDPHPTPVQAMGGGSYVTTFGFGVQKSILLGAEHVLRYRLNVTQSVNSVVHVTGFNSYGGGFGTDGRVSPGPVTTIIVAAEASLTRHWGLALDIGYQLVDATQFSGTAGIDLQGNPAQVGKGSSMLLSAAPALEYHPNAHIGVIAGPWLTLFGRNATQFVGGVGAVYFFF